MDPVKNRLFRTLTGWAAAAAVLAVFGFRAEGVGRPTTPEPEPPPATATALSEHGMNVLWQTGLLVPPKTEIVSIWLAGDLVVARSSENRLYAISAASGQRLWSASVAQPHETVWPPAIHKDTLWVATTTKLIGLGASNGSVTWSQDLDFPPSGGIVTNGFHCFIPDTKGWLQAVGVASRAVSWGRWTEGMMTAVPVVDSIGVYFASQSGAVYASAQNVRRVRWRYRTGGPVVADLRRGKGGLVLVASLDYSVYAFQGASGRLAWRYNAGEPVAKPPYTCGNRVFVFTDEGGLATLGAGDGKSKWQLAEAADFISADADAVYVRSWDDRLLAVSPDDGKVRFAVPLRRDALVAPNESGDGKIYLATPTGQVMAAKAGTKGP